MPLLRLALNQWTNIARVLRRLGNHMCREVRTLCSFAIPAQLLIKWLHQGPDEHTSRTLLGNPCRRCTPKETALPSPPQGLRQNGVTESIGQTYRTILKCRWSVRCNALSILNPLHLRLEVDEPMRPSQCEGIGRYLRPMDRLLRAVT